MAAINFDAREVDPAQEMKPLPEGEYKAAIIASENKPTKAGTGSYLALTFEVLDGSSKGRRLWANLNLNNPNATAVEIAKSELSAICHAVGVMTPRDSAELHNKPMMLSVKCEKRRDNGELSNRIKGYKSLAAAAEEKPQPAAAGVGPAPWEK